MYIELFIPMALAGVGTVVYGKYKTKDSNLEDYEIMDEIDDDCPILMFDNLGNYYYVYE
jgi:hypothetical protein